jgi:putative endonuclease
MLKKSIGDQAEKRALKFLQKKGYKLKDKNFHCRYGEIDLIMMNKQNELIFVEVRCRNNTSHGDGFASITTQKQSKIRNSAEYYLQVHQLNEQACRCDAISVQLNGRQTKIEWIQDAF